MVTLKLQLFTSIYVKFGSKGPFNNRTTRPWRDQVSEKLIYQPTEHFYNGCSRRQISKNNIIDRSSILFLLIKSIRTCFCRQIWHENYLSLLKNALVTLKHFIFYPTLTRIMDSFSCSPLNTSFYIRKTWKGFQNILNSLWCDLVTSFNITMTSRIDVQLFLSFLGLVRVCEINNFTWVKAMEIPIWCARKVPNNAEHV